MDEQAFGPHLMLDAYNCSTEVLDDANMVYRMLDELPDLIGMHKMTKPYIVHSKGNDGKDPGGWSGFVLIEESHISIHTFVKRGFATIDVYSCKPFDTKKALEYFKEILKTEDFDFSIESRGRRYPPENTK